MRGDGKIQVFTIFAIILGVKIQRLLKKVAKMKIIIAKIGNKGPVYPTIS